MTQTLRTTASTLIGAALLASTVIVGTANAMGDAAGFQNDRRLAQQGQTVDAPAQPRYQASGTQSATIDATAPATTDGDVVLMRRSDRIDHLPGNRVGGR